MVYRHGFIGPAHQPPRLQTHFADFDDLADVTLGLCTKQQCGRRGQLGLIQHQLQWCRHHRRQVLSAGWMDSIMRRNSAA